MNFTLKQSLLSKKKTISYCTAKDFSKVKTALNHSFIFNEIVSEILEIIFVFLNWKKYFFVEMHEMTKITIVNGMSIVHGF